MARVEKRPSGKHFYAVVVEDVPNGPAQRKKSVLRSFGNWDEEKNVEDAHKYVLGHEIQKRIKKEMDRLKKKMEVGGIAE